MTSHHIASSISFGDLVFDIGANQGDKAQWFVNRGARVVCVEPQPAMAQLIRERFPGNPNVEVVEKALGAKPGRLPMSINTAAPMLSTLAGHWKEGRFANLTWDTTVEVEVSTLDDLVAKYGVPKYCKIDVEGFELEAMRGLSSRIGTISFEFTSEFITHAMEVIEILIRLGYRNFNVSLGEQSEFQFPAWVPYYEIVRALLNAATPGSLMWGDVYAE